MKTLPHRLCSHLINTSRNAVATTPVPYTESSLGILSILLRHGLISNLTLGDPHQPNPAKFPTLPASYKRLWIDLKYRNGLPVMRRLTLVSKPSLRVSVTREELGRILIGKRARNVGGIGMGEIIVVRTETDRNAGRIGRDCYMDGWQAWRAGIGGELLCRVS